MSEPHLTNGDRQVHCPSCGSDHIRHARYKSIAERFASVFGIHPLRCKDCQYRFASRVWRLVDLRYSRCPRCYRTVLSTWSESHYIPRFWTLIWLRLGARRLRCEFCRFNFAGFRPVKEVYSSRYGRGQEAAAILAQESRSVEEDDDE